MCLDVSFKIKGWKKEKKKLNKLGKDFSGIIEEALEKNLIDVTKHAKAQQFPTSFRNVTGNLRLSIGATKDAEIKKMKRRGKIMTINGVMFLSKAMKGDKRVTKIGDKIIGKFIISMQYASQVEAKYGFAIKSLEAEKNTFKKHLDKDINIYKNKNKIR